MVEFYIIEKLPLTFDWQSPSYELKRDKLSMTPPLRHPSRAPVRAGINLIWDSHWIIWDSHWIISGFAERRAQFWIDSEEHLSNIQNALSEALVVTAEAGTSTRIPYTLAWMPGQNRKTVEVIAWAAKHHPDPWVRRFSVYFVVEFGGHEDLAAPLLQDRAHYPAYTVRKEVLIQRIK